MRKLLLTALVAASTTSMAWAEIADSVLKNGTIYTVDEQNPNAQAIAIKDGKIVYVGDDKGVAEFIGEGTKVNDLQGKFVLPGFIDTHAHYATASALAGVLNLKQNDTPEIWKKQIKAYADANPQLDSILGFGVVNQKFGIDGPTKEMLDELVPDRPAVIIGGGGHTAWFNSKALEKAGITKDTPDPVSGVHMFKRNAKGEPTGYHLEAMSFYPYISKMGLMKTEMVKKGAEKVFPMLPAAGVTAYFDAGMAQMEEKIYPAIAELEKEGKLPVRIVGTYMVQSPQQAPIAVERIKDLQKRYQSELIRPNSVKIHNDGTTEAQTAALWEDYIGSPGEKGEMLLAGDKLKTLVTDLAKNDIHMHMHAIGDKTVTEGLDAVEYARKQVPNTKSRFTIAHTILTRDEDVPRFGKLDVIMQSTPLWLSNEGVAPNLGEKRALYQAMRFGSIEEGGAKLTFGSDFPVGVGPEVLPLYNIEVGMTRKGFGEKDIVMPREKDKLSLETMIKGYTINAAYQCGLEDEIGSLEVGKKADIVVLDKNLFKIKPTDIHNVQVVETIMNGKTTFKK